MWFVDFVQQHDELIAAKPRHDIARPQATLQTLGHLDQQSVAVGVTERIIDDLEAVEVDEQHRALPAMAQRHLDRRAQELAEHHPVRQTGQPVVGRKILDPRLGFLLLVGAIEILEREGNICGNTLQQLDKLRDERARLAGEE